MPAPLKIMLLLYLSLAVMLPSYQGFGEGKKLHFFAFSEPASEYHHHSHPEIEASHDRSHSHAVIHYYPGQRQQRLNTADGNTLTLIFTAGSTALAGSTAKSGSIHVYPRKVPPDIFAEAFSGLSPPLI